MGSTVLSYTTQPSWAQPAWSGTGYSPAEAWDGVTQALGLRPMGTAVFRAAPIPEDFGLLPSHCLLSLTWPWLVLRVTYADLSRRRGRVEEVPCQHHIPSCTGAEFSQLPC